MAKKIVTIILIVIILAGLGALTAFLIIKNTPQGKSVTDTVKNFFPFGKAPESSTGTGTTGENTQTGGQNNTSSGIVILPRLRQIVNKPVAGITSITTKSGSTTLETIRFIERANGNVFDNRTNSLAVTRVSNTTIPKVYEAKWTNDGSGVYVRYLRDKSDIIETLYANLSKVATTTPEGALRELIGSHLPENIQSLTLSPSGKIFYLGGGVGGGIGTIANADGGKPVAILNSSFSEWLPDWSYQNTIVMTTKPAANIPGFLYFLNPSTGSFVNILKNVPGLTALSDQNASELIYSTGSGGHLQSFLYTIKNPSATPLQVATLPEKCVWSKQQKEIFCAVPQIIPVGNYPDSWYQGLVSFSDDIWKIDTVTGVSTKIASILSLAGTEIDAVKLSLTPSEDYLIFINKKDNTPWVLRLTPDIATQS